MVIKPLTLWNITCYKWQPGRLKLFYKNQITIAANKIGWLIRMHHVSLYEHRQMIARNASLKRHQMETFPRYWPFVREIHRWPVNSPHKGQWLGALIFSLIWALTNGWLSHRDAGDLRRHRAHYDVTVMEMTLAIIAVIIIIIVIIWWKPILNSVVKTMSHSCVVEG